MQNKRGNRKHSTSDLDDQPLVGHGAEEDGEGRKIRKSKQYEANQLTGNARTPNKIYIPNGGADAFSKPGRAQYHLRRAETKTDGGTHAGMHVGMQTNSPPVP